MRKPALCRKEAESAVGEVLESDIRHDLTYGFDWEQWRVSIRQPAIRTSPVGQHDHATAARFQRRMEFWRKTAFLSSI